MIPSTPLNDIDQLVDELVTRIVAAGGRFILGVAGPPGAGKSTLASEVVILVAGRLPTVVAPLDGFHRSNEELEAMGLQPLRGIPDSFDAAAFVALLERVRAGEPVEWPTYDRARETVVAGAIPIGADCRLVVVEGNYLLLDVSPWDRVRPLLDEVWYLDVPEDVLIPRLVARHARNRTESAAVRKVATTDLPNASLVAAHKENATRIVSDDAESF